MSRMRMKNAWHPESDPDNPDCSRSSTTTTTITATITPQRTAFRCINQQCTILFLLLHCAIFHPSIVQGWEVHILPAAHHLLNLKSHENVAIICSVIGLQKGHDSEVDIKWYREDNDNPIVRLERIAVSRVKPLSARLLFIKPTVEDGGLYKCVISVGGSGGGQTKEKSTRISFIQAAEFIDVETEQHPEDGKIAEIVCRVRGDPSLEIFWQFDGKTILEGGPRDYEFRDGNQILVIPKFNAELDDGLYTCSAAQFYSFETVVINVTAYARPQITVLDGAETMQSVEGRDFVIKCQAVGKPRPDYQWIKYADGDEKILVPSEKYELNNGTLTIRQLIPADRGTYSCIAKNVLDEARLDYNLTVFRKPRLKPMENLTRSRGDKVELICEFTGDGEMKANWVHLGQQWPALGRGNRADRISGSKFGRNNPAGTIANGDDNRVTVSESEGTLVLTVSTVDEDDSGLYQCVVENEAGTDQRSVFLSIIHAARVVDHSGTKRAVKGSTAEIHCGASAVPEPVWTWTGPSGTIYADGSKYILDTHTVTTTLTIRDVNEQDFGKYTCTADNGVGPSDHADLHLIEILPPLVPAELNCHEKTHPNFGICSIGDLKNATLARLPTNITFYIVHEDEENKGKTVNATFEFDGRHEFKLYELKPKSRYKVRVQAINDAGVSELSDPDIIETTDPKVPEAPKDIHYDCSKLCKMAWNEPNDRGSPITAYKLILREVAQINPREYGAESYELDLGADDRKVDLSFLKPLTTYEVMLIAVNDVGKSNAHSILLNTSEFVEGGRHADGSSLFRVILFIILSALMLILSIDFVCCLKRHRGLFALVSSICLDSTGRKADESKTKNGLQNDKTENNRLLTDERSDPPTAEDSGEKRTNAPHSTSV